MKQPLMFMPPAQAEVLSDGDWAEAVRGVLRAENAEADARFAFLNWQDDDLPDEALYSSEFALPGDAQRRRMRVRDRAA